MPSAYIETKPRSQHEVITSMLMSAGFSYRTRQQQMFILGRAKSYDIDYIGLLQAAWNVPRDVVEQKIKEMFIV